MRIDRVAITGSTPYNPFSLFRQKTIDAADGSAATTAWGPALTEGTFFETGGNFRAPSPHQVRGHHVPVRARPAGSTITSVDLSLKYKAAGAGSLCVYFEGYSGATLLGTTGSSGSPWCSDKANNWKTDTITLTGGRHRRRGERPARYGSTGRRAAAARGQFDLIELRANYYLGLTAPALTPL